MRTYVKQIFAYLSWIDLKYFGHKRCSFAPSAKIPLYFEDLSFTLLNLWVLYLLYIQVARRVVSLEREAIYHCVYPRNIYLKFHRSNGCGSLYISTHMELYKINLTKSTNNINMLVKWFMLPGRNLLYRIAQDYVRSRCMYTP